MIHHHSQNSLELLKGKKSAIIFDMDGVLFHSTIWHKKAFLEILKPYLDSHKNLVFDYQNYAGMKTIETIQKVMISLGITINSEELNLLAKKKTDLAHQYLHDFFPVAKNCKEILSHLHRYFQLFLASSASLQNVNLFLEKSETMPYFSNYISGSQVEKGKPAPEIYHKIVQSGQLDSQECLVVEDAPMGIIAARNANLDVLGLTGTTSSEELLAAGALSTIDQLEQLLLLI